MEKNTIIRYWRLKKFVSKPKLTETPTSKAEPVQQHHKGGVQQHDQDHWLDPHCPGTNSSWLADTQDLKLFLTFPGSIRKFAQWLEAKKALSRGSKPERWRKCDRRCAQIVTKRGRGWLVVTLSWFLTTKGNMQNVSIERIKQDMWLFVVSKMFLILWVQFIL